MKQSYRNSVGRGFLWILATSGFGKSAALISHICLGWWLLDSDWGVYSIAFGVIAFVEFLRNGGVHNIVVQRGREAYTELSGPAFWMAATFNGLACLTLVSLSQVLADYFGHSELYVLLIAAGATFPLGTPASVLRAKLQLDLKFRALAIVHVLTLIGRAAVMILAAYVGAEAYTFAFGMIASATLESLLLWIACRDAPWMRAAKFSKWTIFLKDTGWLTVGSFMESFAIRGDYLILSVVIGVNYLGQYMFALQLVSQLSVIIAINAQIVLFPVFSRMLSDPGRVRRSVEKSMGTLVLIVALPSYLFAVIAVPLELAIWDGKWSDSMIAGRIFAFGEPMRCLLIVMVSIVLAQGKYKSRVVLMTGNALIVMGGAGTGALLFGSDVRMIAAIATLFHVFFAITSSAILARGIGCDLAVLASKVFRPIIVLAPVGVLALLADASIFFQYAPATRMVMGGSLYFVLVWLLLRRYLSSYVMDITSTIQSDFLKGLILKFLLMSKAN